MLEARVRTGDETVHGHRDVGDDLAHRASRLAQGAL
jgi:hypothetical protein